MWPDVNDKLNEIELIDANFLRTLKITGDEINSLWKNKKSEGSIYNEDILNYEP